MMKTKIWCLAVSYLAISTLVYTQSQPGMVSGEPNLQTFTPVFQNITNDEVILLNAGHENHPEMGMVYNDVPCEDCFEIIEKRTPSTKYFVKKGTGGSYVYQQSSTDLMHLTDEHGNLRTIITELQPDASANGLYSANFQPIPAGIHTALEHTYLGKDQYKFLFHQNLALVFTNSLDQVVSSTPANWSNYTAGNNGVYITDAWDGIDIELLVMRGQIKSNYIIKKPLTQFAGGTLRIRDNWELPQNAHLVYPAQNEFHHGIQVTSQNNDVLYEISPVIAYDEHSRTNMQTGELNYHISANTIDIIIPQEWFNKSDLTAYPITIDPLFQGTNSMAIAGSGYNAVCFAGGCSYNLSVPVPAAITITDVRWSFSYMTSGFLCWMSDGAVDFQLGACRSPGTAGFYWFCNNPSGGTCNGNNVSIYSDLAGCLPAPQCPAYNLNFTMRFYRCYTAGAGCSNTCIAAATPLTMVVEGRTVEPTSLITTLPAVTICQGQSTTLTASGQNGVPAYTYTWNPGALAGSPSVSPAATTTYTVTITDQCGNTTTATKVVNVTANNNPGFTISPNPACPGQTITITGLGAGAAANYDWTLPSSANPTVNNTKVFTTTYASSGTYPITLNYASGVCIFPLVQNVVIGSNTTPTINITQAPAGAICAGASVTFTANITGGGTAPVYQWQVNGINAGTNSNTFTTTTLNNGDVVTCILTSNDPCATSTTATSNAITITVNPNLTPTINITALPAGAICAGSSITFTANITNGGAAPIYQWQVNGANAGTNSNTFTTTTLNNGDVVTCILTSNAPCVTSTTANSNSITVTVNPVLVPSVTISASPAGTICSGTNVTFTALPVNGGSAPSYQWQVNGINTGPNSPTFSSGTLNNGDIITVILTSNAVCASPLTATSNTITMTVTPTVIPTINISAAPAGPICAGTAVTFTANITNGGAAPVYQWQVNVVNTGTNSNTYTSSSLNNGDVVTCILTSNAPCASPASVTSANITMQVNPLVTPTISIVSNQPLPACAGTNLSFTANITNGGPNPVYQWQVNGINTGGNSSSFSSSTLNAGDVITATLVSDAACTTTPNASSNNITITYYPAVSLTAGNNVTLCAGELAILSVTPASGNPASYTVNWQPGNYSGNSITTSPSVTTTYTATVTDACGSTATTTVTATVYPAPIAGFTYGPMPAALDQQPTNFTDISTNAVGWHWNFDDGNTSSSQNPVHEFTASGTYHIVLVVTSPDQCTDTAMTTIILEDIYSLFIPSAFTPNDDPNNPTFNAYGGGITYFRMEIYDRWGENIFTTELMDKGWDGTLKNEPAPQGVYTYRIEVEFSNKKTETILGKVTLLR